MTDIRPLRRFVTAIAALADDGADEARFLDEGTRLLSDLVGRDDWLPDTFAEAGPTYRQNLLFCDAAERFSVVAFVWGPGQRTPVHDHTVWGLVGMLRGQESSTLMFPDPAGGPMRADAEERLDPGAVVAVSPNLHDVHAVANALVDRPSISIHVYGGNIGAVSRHVFDPATSARRAFVSGYSNQVMPNIWL